MTSDEARMRSASTSFLVVFRHSCLVIISSFVLRQSSFSGCSWQAGRKGIKSICRLKITFLPGGTLIMHRYRRIACALLVTFGASFATGADWRQFRGPDGLGISNEKNLPAEWS